MSKEKVFIVISHKRVLKKGNRVGSKKAAQDDWEIAETVEFVNQLKQKHITMSSATADYINRKMLSGHHLGMSDYDRFENYVQSKYPKQLAELDAAYKEQQIKVEMPIPEPQQDLITDEFGNLRVRTIFDPV